MFWKDNSKNSNTSYSNSQLYSFLRKSQRQVYIHLKSGFFVSIDYYKETYSFVENVNLADDADLCFKRMEYYKIDISKEIARRTITKEYHESMVLKYDPPPPKNMTMTNGDGI